MSRYWRCALGLALALALASCDDTFEPFGESEYLYAIAGYLNASADTQWVRIMPLRQSASFVATEPLDATVTLTNLDDGSSVVLRDSLFAHAPAVFLDSADTTYTHTFWTTKPIVRGAHYRLVITRKDGATAAATATIPPDYPVVLEYPVDPEARRVLEVSGVNLALVSWRTPMDCPPFLAYQYFYDLPSPVPPPEGGVYRVPIVPNSTPPQCAKGGSGLFVVVSDIVWPEGLGNLDYHFPNLNIASNLTNAEGLFAGVLSKAVPTDPSSCALEPQTGPCRLTFTSTSAGFRGQVVDQSCGTSVSRATVQLREVPTGSGPVRVRTVSTAGVFRFELLDPGRRYALRASYPAALTATSPPAPVYGVVEDTISLTPGQILTRNIILPRVAACDGIQR